MPLFPELAGIIGISLRWGQGKGGEENKVTKLWESFGKKASP